MDIILASGSPRRRELLEMLGVKNLIIHPAAGEEHIEPGTPPDAAVMTLASRKAREVAPLFPDGIVIGCDTVVALDGCILGKPRSPEEARDMLGRLSGREHTVYTGLCVIGGGREHIVCEHTAVRFRPLSAGEIARYVATGEPMDKAGAYGIQGRGSLLVEGIDGDYFTVMGLPLCRLGLILGKLGVDLL